MMNSYYFYKEWQWQITKGHQLIYIMAGIGSVSIENVIFKMHDDVKNLSNQLVLDMLMSKFGKDKIPLTYEVIANITKFIGVSEYELRMISVIAKSILLQRCDESERMD